MADTPSHSLFPKLCFVSKVLESQSSLDSQQIDRVGKGLNDSSQPSFLPPQSGTSKNPNSRPYTNARMGVLAGGEAARQR